MSIQRCRISCVFIAAVSGTVLLHWLQPAGAQDRELGAGGELLESVAAVVDEGIVLQSELSERLDLVMKNLERQQQEVPPEQRRPLPPLSVIEQQVLEQLIVREVQLQRADRGGITVSDDMLNEALSRVASNLGYTLEELPAVLAAQGIDYAAYREDSRKDLLLEQLEQRDVVARISLTPRELDQCLANADQNASAEFDYNISHILIGVPANASQQDVEAARARIEEIHDRLEAGEDFARLAVATSQAQTALDGGSLGWRKGAQLPTLFADLVIRMKPGEFSAPIQNSGGFQIVRLNDMRGAERLMVDQLRVRHILLRPNEILDDAAIQQKLRGIRAQILAGDDFATVAEAVSEDTASAAEGGDLEWLSPGDTVPEFEQAMANLELNQLSEPVKSRFGWHLIQVLERRSHDTTDENKRLECARQIRAAKAEEERELWLRRLRDQAFVDIRL
jgi:peptidyl-prolyl cis-trans isomerase SurA